VGKDKEGTIPSRHCIQTFPARPETLGARAGTGRGNGPTLRGFLHRDPPAQPC